ncbi:50S ribosomal protein L33 [Cordyceps militaris CM01]|uniref:Large ribosomal subunit protein bL33m n=1 Tax=Cordyceps militaris (strain CM01) TaxID=983644 RepID=G3JFG1_CORMM|nr:50S ribosomal protein L33 [Cordyceps militaris CM01]EGX93151.1 50S ribosomal protein L33 [Cordyceps militaris CM01]
MRTTTPNPASSRLNDAKPPQTWPRKVRIASPPCHSHLSISQLRDCDAVNPYAPVANLSCDTAKTRLIHVRLLSMAMTGFFYTFKRPRTALPMGLLKYDPIVRKKVLFLESKRKGK